MTLCILCPGQGNQTPETLTRLISEPLIATHLEPLLAQMPFDALQVAGHSTQCYLNRYAQPLIVASGAAVSLALRSHGLHIGLCAGYSVGELTAQVTAGGLLAHQAVELAVQRSHWMDQYAPSGFGMMAVKGVRLDTLESAIQSHGLEVAIVNDSQHVVLAGKLQMLESACRYLQEELGAHVVHLNVTVPSHTPWLKTASERFRDDLERVRWFPFECPVLSALDGNLVETRDGAIDALARQVSDRLQWSRTLELTEEMGVSAFFEVGPGNSLTRMVRERFPDLPSRSLSEFHAFDGALNWLANHAH